MCVCINTHTHTYTHTLIHTVVSDSLWPHGLQPTRPLCPWDSPGKNTRVGCIALLQGIFPTQGSNPCPLHPLLWETCSLPLCLQESPYICIHIHKWCFFGRLIAKGPLTMISYFSGCDIVSKVRLLCDEYVNMSPTSYCHGWNGQSSRAGGKSDSILFGITCLWLR